MVVETRYVTSGEVFVAYQISRQDGPDLLMTPGFVSHLEQSWENPNAARFLNELGSFSRLIRFDKRGTGLSDRGVGVPHLDERIDDIAPCSTPRVLGGRTCSVSPRAGRCRSCSRRLILNGSPVSSCLARMHAQWAVPFDDFAGLERDIRSNWGTGKSLPSFSPSAAAVPGAMERFAKFERSAASPSDVINLMRMNREIDVTAILPSIHVPTLVMHRREDVRIRALAGRELGERISNARYIELPGSDHLPSSGDQDRLVEEIRKFMGVSATAVEVDRVLSTVLFTDTVDSTRRASLMGDRQWRSTLAHHAAVRSELERHRGREVKTTGDGFLALFDGPARAVRCAQRIVSAVRPLDLEVRAGVHTGEIEMMGDDVGGIAVHIAARVAQHAKASEVLASSTVKDLVAGAGLKFVDQGPAELKGLAEPMRLFAAVT